MKKKSDIKLITKNKKAYFDYEILDSWEAWIELKWYEVKSIKQRNVNLKWAYIVKENNELFIKAMHISAWSALPNKKSIDTFRLRKILLHKKTINFLIWKLQEKWYSVIPLEIYEKNRLIKVKIWLAKWRKKYEKKQVLKERTLEKEAKLKMMKYL
jgi:SsrA-binding protein